MVAGLGEALGLVEDPEEQGPCPSPMAAVFTPGKGKIIEDGKSLEPPCLTDGEREFPEG